MVVSYLFKGFVSEPIVSFCCSYSAGGTPPSEVCRRSVLNPGDVLDDGELELGSAPPDAVADQLGLEAVVAEVRGGKRVRLSRRPSGRRRVEMELAYAALRELCAPQQDRPQPRGSLGIHARWPMQTPSASTACALAATHELSGGRYRSFAHGPRRRSSSISAPRGPAESPGESRSRSPSTGGGWRTRRRLAEGQHELWVVAALAARVVHRVAAR